MKIMERQTTKFGYPMSSAIIRPELDVVKNIYDEDRYLSISQTIFNNQMITLSQTIGKPPKDQLIGFMSATELDLDREITKYKIMLDIDPNYKLHKDHPLIKNTTSV